MDSGYKDLSVTQQCRVLGISRSIYYYEGGEEKENRDLGDLQLILEVLGRIPFYGYRKVSRQLIEEHPQMTRKRVRRIMRRFGLRALYPTPVGSKYSSSLLADDVAVFFGPYSIRRV